MSKTYFCCGIYTLHASPSLPLDNKLAEDRDTFFILYASYVCSTWDLEGTKQELNKYFYDDHYGFLFSPIS